MLAAQLEFMRAAPCHLDLYSLTDDLIRGIEEAYGY
jgi:hypothetical protein